MLDQHPAEARHLPPALERIVEALAEEHVQVSCDIVPIDDHTWAVHGSISVDGEVILAEFDDLDDAELAAQEIAESTDERGVV